MLALEAGPLGIAFLFAEEGADVVEDILHEATSRCSDEDADTLEDILERSGVELDSDFSVDLWKAAGRLKARWGRVSLADCFALALANREQATIVTSDHHEFDRLAHEEVCAIRFIR